MMRPQQLYDNIDNLFGVVDDSMVSIRKARGEGKTSGEVPTLDQELFKFATECKTFDMSCEDLCIAVADIGDGQRVPCPPF